MSNQCVRRTVAHALFLFFPLLILFVPRSLLAQEETNQTGTIQGTIRDEEGHVIENARILFRSRATFTNGVTRSGKDGTYVTEPVPPGDYTIRVESRDQRGTEITVTVKGGAATTADFHLESTNPAPPRLESRPDLNVLNTLPMNGRQTPEAARLEPGIEIVDGTFLSPEKSGFQVLSINSTTGRTVHYDLDEVEAMDETYGTLVQNLPATGVHEMIVARALTEPFQALNAMGSVRLVTQSGSDEWHANAFGQFRTRAIGMAGFPSGDPHYSRQYYGFGVGGALVKDRAFLYVSGERGKQDGSLPFWEAFPFAGLSLRKAYFRENMLTGRLDYNFSEYMKGFYRFSYDNSNQIGPTDSQAGFRDQINVPAHVVGLDWNHGRFAHSGRFGYQKLVTSINPELGSNTLIWPATPFHQHIGSFELGPSATGPRQTIQSDIFGRYDSRTNYREIHTIRFGGAIHRISQGDFYAPGFNGPSVTSSTGSREIDAINRNTNLLPLFPGDPLGAAGNPTNYPVGTITLYNGLGTFSEHSAFNRSAGGHFDTRMELYVSDTVKLFPFLNLTAGVTYVRDTGRVNSDLGSVLCSSINTSIVSQLPCTGNNRILDAYGSLSGIGKRVTQPDWNFAPQVGVAWDPFRNGSTVVRAGIGMYFDNFLFSNSYQDRLSRLSNGQYFRSLTLCPNGSVLFPDGSVVNSVDGLDIAKQICGQPVGTVSTAIQDLQNQFLATQATVTGGPNLYSLSNSLANFGGMLASDYRTPRVVHINAGMTHQFGKSAAVSIDYVRQVGTQMPLGIDTNHVGDARFLNSSAALAAINRTVTAVGCPAAASAGSQSQAAVACYLATVPSHSIVDFARNGLDSSNAFCGPFPCSVVGLPAAAFSGINPLVGSNVMYFTTGRSAYDALQVGFKFRSAPAVPGVRSLDFATSYTFSKYRTNVAEPNGAGGDYSLLTVAQDYNNPHVGHWGPSGLDRRNFINFAPSITGPKGVRLSLIGQLASPLPLTVYAPQADGGGVAGEIYRTDFTGDGTVGDLVPFSSIGGAGARKASDLTKLIAYFNANVAGKLTPQAQTLVLPNGRIPALMTVSQLDALGAVVPLLQPLPAHPAEATWFKNFDLRLSWALRVKERFTVEPSVAVFNVLNLANFGTPGAQLNGVLDGSPGSSLNNASNGGNCGTNPAFCTARLDRIAPGSGTYNQGAPRQLEFGVKLSF